MSVPGANNASSGRRERRTAPEDVTVDALVRGDRGELVGEAGAEAGVPEHVQEAEDAPAAYGLVLGRPQPALDADPAATDRVPQRDQDTTHVTPPATSAAGGVTTNNGSRLTPDQERRIRRATTPRGHRPRSARCPQGVVALRSALAEPRVGPGTVAS
ncbi:hypothetical protein GCM10010415_37350 [Streptomyces atrovirens]